MKRSGVVVDYDSSKIFNAIAGASKAVNDSLSTRDIQKVVDQVESAIENWEN
ncbi:ATP cone domain-containing protein, partial [Anaerovibrio sp.]|uniref:ATP cone domain-containing protein n=1 Tax=Anaerovibrio sp. TaxID=1872532 RepID=UPI00388EDB17